MRETDELLDQHDGTSEVPDTEWSMEPPRLSRYGDARIVIPLFIGYEPVLSLSLDLGTLTLHRRALLANVDLAYMISSYTFAGMRI